MSEQTIKSGTKLIYVREPDVGRRATGIFYRNDYGVKVECSYNTGDGRIRTEWLPLGDVQVAA